MKKSFILFVIVFAVGCSHSGASLVQKAMRKSQSSWSTLRVAVNLAVLGSCDAPPERAPDGRTYRGWVIQVRFDSARGFVHESQPGSWFFEESHAPASRIHIGLRCGTRRHDFSSFVGRPAASAGFASITDTAFTSNVAGLARVCNEVGVVFQTYPPFLCY